MKISTWLLAAGLIFPLATNAAQSERYPARPIRLIVPSAPGGGMDILARFIGQRLTEQWHQQVVVDDRPGATGIIGTEIEARAMPDGYTLELAWVSPLAINPGLYRKLPYNVERDLAPIMMVATTPNLLVVRPSLNVASVKDFIALAKAEPGKLTFASSGIGSLSDLAGEMLKAMAGIDIVHVPYKGTPAALIDLMAGRVDTLFAVAAPTLPYIKQGKLKALAVSNPHRWAAMPELPTVAETLPGFAAVNWYGFMAPAGTPQRIIDKLNAEVARYLKAPAVTQKLANMGFLVAGTSPQECAQYIHAEQIKWKKVIEAAGIRPE